MQAKLSMPKFRMVEKEGSAVAMDPSVAGCNQEGAVDYVVWEKDDEGEGHEWWELYYGTDHRATLVSPGPGFLRYQLLRRSEESLLLYLTSHWQI